MKVEVTKETAIFLKHLANEILSQNSRGTASPYFYVVQSKREIIVPQGYGEKTVYYNPSIGQYFSKDDWRDYLSDNGIERDLEEFLSECEVADISYVDQEENVFLTEAGYKEHMKQNGHNYRHLKETYSYLKPAYRNPEMTLLLSSIIEFKDIEISD